MRTIKWSWHNLASVTGSPNNNTYAKQLLEKDSSLYAWLWQSGLASLRSETSHGMGMEKNSLDTIEVDQVGIISL